MAVFTRYLRFLSLQIVKTANTKTANSEGLLPVLKKQTAIFFANCCEMKDFYTHTPTLIDEDRLKMFARRKNNK